MSKKKYSRSHMRKLVIDYLNKKDSLNISRGISNDELARMIIDLSGMSSNRNPKGVISLYFSHLVIKGLITPDIKHEKAKSKPSKGNRDSTDWRTSGN